MADKNNNAYAPYTPSEDSDKKLRKYLALFRLAWKEARPYFDLANEDVRMFNQDVNPDRPTLSDITLAQARLFVDQALPPLMSRLFDADNPFDLIPTDAKIEYETARKIRDLVLYNMRTHMQIERNGYLTLREAVKLGKGYGIIEPRIITPPISEEQIVMTGNEEVRNRVMGIGKTELVPGYTCLPFGTVIPTPDGATPDDVSCVFVLRMFQEEPFRKMFDKKLNPDTPFEGPVEKIIERARSKIFNGYLATPRQIATQIASLQRSPAQAMNESGSDTPVIIPVLQCFSRDEHVWFACDQFEIYSAKAKYQTLRNPVVAATFDPDGSQWFTPGIIRPRRRMIMGSEDFFNAIMDMISMSLHPHQIVNRDALISEDQKTDMQPYGRTYISGSAKAADVISWAQLPQLPAYVFEAGNKLEEHDTASVGQPKSLQGQGTPGLVRGGSGAMESLLQSTSGREKLTARHVEQGWYSSVVENTLVLSQMLAKDKQYLPAIKYNPENKGGKNKNEFNFSEITRSDIRRVYSVQLSFTDKMRNEMAEFSMKTAKYDRLVENENVNRQEALAWLIGNDRDYNRLTAGVNPEDNLKTMQALAQAQQAKPAGGTSPAAASEIPAIGGAGAALGGLGV